MRVLHIGKYFPPASGGMERYLGELVAALEEQNVTSYVLAHTWDNTEPSLAHPSPKVTVQRVPTYGQVCYVPIAPAFPIYLIKAIRSFKPGVIHIHMPNASGLWALLTTFSIPVVIHWHADTIFPPEKKIHRALYALYRPFESWLLRKADNIIATSNRYLEHSKPLRPHHGKCLVIPLGIQSENLPVPTTSAIHATRQQWLKNDETNLIVSIGRFAYYKGFHNLVSAMQHVEHAHLVMIGSGEEFAAIEKQISECNLNDKITLAGRVNDDELHQLLAAADVFCLPSIERTEAFGMVLLEAMHHNTPCVSTSIPGSATDWVNKNGETGLVVSPDNISELADALNKLTTDATLRKQFSAAATSRLQECFHINRTVKQLSNLYTKILGS